MENNKMYRITFRLNEKEYAEFNQKYNQTVIVITHDENIALEADRILTIDDGKIVKDERVR